MSKTQTQQLIAWDRAHVWHPFTPMKPWIEQKDFLIIERGKGEFLFDTAGKKYIDATSSIWCNVHGHGVPEIDRAVKLQLSKVAHTTLLGMGSVPSILLAKKLVELAANSSMDLPRIFYSDNGSTAVEVACKMAFQSWKNAKRKTRNAKRRARFVAFENSYHGDTLGAVSIGGIEAFHGAFKPLCFETDFVRVGEHAARDVERLLAKHPGQYAGVVIEPIIQGAGGMILHASDTLKKIRAACTKHGVALIADEVMTGFGRTGKMFACEHEKVTPDFLCLSKGITGGYMPLGVTMTTQKVFDAFYADPREAGGGKTFFHGHTFTGHPLACAAAIASIDLFTQRKLLSHVAKMSRILADMLQKARDLPYVYDVRQSGLIGAIELRDKNAAPFDYHWRVGGAVCRSMRDKKPIGIITRPLADVVVVMPPLAISEKSMRYLCRGVLESLAGVGGIVEAKRREFSLAPAVKKERRS